MKGKIGQEWMTKFLGEVIIGIIGLIIIIATGVIIFNAFNLPKIQEAKGSLRLIEQAINEARIQSNGGKAGVFIYNPSSWYLISFKESDTGIKSPCEKSCICICEKDGSCKIDLCKELDEEILFFPPKIKEVILEGKLLYLSFVYKKEEPKNIMEVHLIGGIKLEEIFTDTKVVEYDQVKETIKETIINYPPLDFNQKGQNIYLQSLLDPVKENTIMGILIISLLEEDTNFWREEWKNTKEKTDEMKLDIVKNGAIKALNDYHSRFRNLKEYKDKCNLENKENKEKITKACNSKEIECSKKYMEILIDCLKETYKSIIGRDEIFTFERKTIRTAGENTKAYNFILAGEEKKDGKYSAESLERVINIKIKMEELTFSAKSFQ